MRNIGPTQATLGASITYQIEFNNNSQAVVPGVLVSEALIEGLAYENSTPAARAVSGRLEWELGNVAPGESRKIDVRFRVERGGVFNLCAQVRTADGRAGQSCATTSVVVPTLEVRVSPMEGFQSAVVGQEVTFEIRVTNRGTIAAAGLVIRDEFDPGLEHAVAPSPIERDLADLAPGESKAIHVTLKVVRTGRFCNRAEVTNAEGVRASGQACITAVAQTPQPPPAASGTQRQPGTPVRPIEPPSVRPEVRPQQPAQPPAQAQTPPQQPQAQQQPPATRPTIITPPSVRPPPPANTLPGTPSIARPGGSAPGTAPPARAAPPASTPRTEPEIPQVNERARVSVRVTGPATQELGGTAEFLFEITNTGEVPLTNLVVTDSFSPALNPKQASSGFKWDANDMVWEFPRLEAGKSILLQSVNECQRLAAKACHKVVVTAQEGVTDTDEACVEIRTLPGQLSISVADLRDFIPVGKDITYVIEVTNTGKGADKNISVMAILPPEVSLVPIGTQGPTGTRHTLEGRNVRFYPPVPELAAGKSLTYRVTVRAEQAGEISFRVHASSAGSQQVLVGETTTTITPE
jgi:uncharacterized repeat protein (TIGR01451 family)